MKIEKRIEEILRIKLKKNPLSVKNFSPTIFNLLISNKKKEKIPSIQKKSAGWVIDEKLMDEIRKQLEDLLKEDDIKGREKGKKILSCLIKLEKFKTEKWFQDALETAIKILTLNEKKKGVIRFLKEKPERVFILDRGVKVGARIPWIVVSIEYDKNKQMEKERIFSIVGAISDDSDISLRHNEIFFR